MPPNTITVIDVEATAKYLQSLFKERNVTPKMIAEALGFSSVASIYKWTAAKSLPSIENAIVLRDYFSISLDDIYVTKQI